jgi:hypothetical protein
VIDHESERVLRYEILALVHRYAHGTECPAGANVFDWCRDQTAERTSQADAVLKGAVA